MNGLFQLAKAGGLRAGASPPSRPRDSQVIGTYRVKGIHPQDQSNPESPRGWEGGLAPALDSHFAGWINLFT
jgi:hypothetical protein